MGQWFINAEYMGTQYQFTVVKMKLIVLIALIGLVAAIPNPYPEEEYGPANGSEFQTTTHTSKKKNTVQPTDLEFQTTTHTSKKKNTVQLTDSEFQTTTTKKDTARDTTTQDATEEDATEEDHASGDAA